MSDRQQSRTYRLLAWVLRLYLRYREWRSKDCPVCEKRMDKLTRPYGYTCLNSDCGAYRCNYPAAKILEAKNVE